MDWIGFAKWVSEVEALTAHPVEVHGWEDLIVFEARWLTSKGKQATLRQAVVIPAAEAMPHYLDRMLHQIKLRMERQQ